MQPFGVLRQLWAQAFRTTSSESSFRTQPVLDTGRTESIPLPNLGSDIIGIAFHGNFVVTSTGVQNPVTGAIATDILDNIDIDDSNGKSVVKLTDKGLFNYLTKMANKRPVMTTLAAFGGPGSKTIVFDFVLPVVIPKSQGIHQMELDFNIANIYAALCTVTSGNIVLTAIVQDDHKIEKFKVLDKSFEILDGDTEVTKLETDRVWSAFGVFDVHDDDPANIDDVLMSHDGFVLIKEKFENLNSCDNIRDDDGAAMRHVADTWFPFRPHVRKTTDYMNIEGDAGHSFTVALLIIAEADPAPPASAATNVPTIQPQAVQSQVVSNNLNF